MTSSIREYDISAKSTDIFGRVLCHARNHHFVVDGPVQNGCPGEELTPPEVFLSGVASCGVELLQVIAKEQSVPLERVGVKIHAMLDRSQQPRENVTLFNAVQVDFEIAGPSDDQAKALVDGFKRR